MIQSLVGMCMIHVLQTTVLLLWILLVSGVSVFSSDDSVSSLAAHGAKVGSSWRPTVMGEANM